MWAKKTNILWMCLVFTLLLSSCARKAPLETQSSIATDTSLDRATNTDLTVLAETKEESKPVSAEAVAVVEVKSILDSGRTEGKQRIPNHSEVEVFKEDGRFGLRYAGTVVQDTVWQELERMPFDNSFYCAQMNGLLGVVGIDGSMPIEPICERIEPFVDQDKNYYVVEIDGLYGLLDAAFRYIEEPTWKYVYTELDQCTGYIIVSASDGNYLYSLEQKKTVGSSMSTSVKYARALSDGIILLTGNNYSAYFGDVPYILGNGLYEGSYMMGAYSPYEPQNRYAVCVYSTELDKTMWKGSTFDRGYANYYRPSPQFLDVEILSQGVVVSYLDSSHRGDPYYIIKNGIIAFSNGVTRCYLSAKKTYIPFDDGQSASVENPVRYSTYDGAFDEYKVIKDAFSSLSIKPLGEGVCLGQNGSSCWLYNLKGEGEKICEFSLNPEQLDNIQYKDGIPYLVFHYSGYRQEGYQSLFAEGWMSVNLSTGVAKEIESIQTMASFSEGLAAVQNTERKWGYIDAEGELVIDYQFDEADPFHDGQAIVIINYKKHKVDKQGNIT